MALRTNIVSIVLIVASATAQSQTRWQDDPLNPHLRQVGRVLSPSVVYDSASHVFQLWETDGYNVFRALSLNGRDWYLSENGPLRRLNVTLKLRFIFEVHVIRVDSLYFMYATGPQLNDTGAIVLATSTDGDNWSLHPSNPVVAPSGRGWQSTGVAYAKVVRTSRGFIMAYGGGDGVSLSGIGIAASPDGISWTKFGEDQVIHPRDTCAIVPCGMTIKDSTCYMLYTSLADSARCIYLATSFDGFHWTPYWDASLLHSGQSGAWNSRNLGEGTLLYLNNKFHFWYSALGDRNDSWQMGYTTSDSLSINSSTHTGSPFTPTQY